VVITAKNAKSANSLAG